jgi:hypothetical protein
VSATKLDTGDEEEMTLEEVLEQNQFLQKALDEAIDLAGIRTGDFYIVAGYGGADATYDTKEKLSCFPALVKYLEDNEQ